MEMKPFAFTYFNAFSSAFSGSTRTHTHSIFAERMVEKLLRKDLFRPFEKYFSIHF
jgi:hypothetical protein